MQMTLSKHSHCHQLRASKMHSQCWRRCTRHGRRSQESHVTHVSFQHLMWEWQSSTSTISALQRRMPISWLWVNCHSLSCTVQSVLTRVLWHTVLDPKKKMGHFMKHWPEDVVKEVEDAVRKHVSRSIFHLILHVADSLCLSLKFIECYSERNNKEQPQATSVRKMAASSKKPGHRNVDDTDSELDEEDCCYVSSRKWPSSALTQCYDKDYL
jgi:hypothetical protein